MSTPWERMTSRQSNRPRDAQRWNLWTMSLIVDVFFYKNVAKARPTYGLTSELKSKVHSRWFALRVQFGWVETFLHQQRGYFFRIILFNSLQQSIIGLTPVLTLETQRHKLTNIYIIIITHLINHIKVYSISNLLEKLQTILIIHDLTICYPNILHNLLHT